jgi:hypothetical protein
MLCCCCASATADTPEDAKVAIANGAQGIGLTRTEHMFFATHQRIAAVRRMIAAVELGSPAAAESLKELQGYQTQVRCCVTSGFVTNIHNDDSCFCYMHGMHLYKSRCCSCRAVCGPTNKQSKGPYSNS